MVRLCIILLFSAIIGCQKINTTGRLLCGNCGRVIYEGEFEGDPKAFRWPVGQINHCKDWDINCVSEFSERDYKHKFYWGYEAGRKSALNFYYYDTFDNKTHHAAYIEGYNKGYKEVIDVRSLSKED